MEFRGELEGLDDLIRRFRRAPGALGGYMRRFLSRAVIVVERNVKLVTTQKRAIATGEFRATITHEVRGTGAEMQGAVGSPKSYAPFVEEDTLPHWPPRRPIIYWVMRKFKLKGEALRAVTRGVQRKIARRGTTGKHVFAEGLEESWGKVRTLWSEIWGEAMEREL